MPRDSNGVFTLVNGYQAIAGQTIQPSQHNPPLEDIAQALTNSLPRDGAAAMTAPIKLSDGTAALPSLAFHSTAGVGLFKSTNGIGFSVGGVQVAEVGASGFLAGAPIGGGMDFFGTTAPAGWLFAFGQNVSRTTYAALWAAMGSPNTGDGSTTFTMPDKRGRASFGKDDMGGTAANRSQVSSTITTTAASTTATVASAAGLAVGMTVISANIPANVTISAINGTALTLSTGTGVTAGTAVAARFSALGDAQVLGSAGGAQTKTLSVAELPSHNHGGDTGAPTQTLQYSRADFSSLTVSSAAPQFNATISPSYSTQTVTGSSHTHSIPSQGGGQPHNILPPGVVCNYIIFAGA